MVSAVAALAFPSKALQRIGTQLEARERRAGQWKLERLGEKAAAVGRGLFCQQRRKRIGELGRALPKLRQPMGSLRYRKLQRLVEQRFQLLPAGSVNSPHNQASGPGTIAALAVDDHQLHAPV